MADRTPTAARLNYPKTDVHRIHHHAFDPTVGHVYTTRCGDELRATAGAMRTTRPVDCQGCDRGGNRG
jgi:hypothetical protein